jgi:cytosine deaminase
MTTERIGAAARRAVELAERAAARGTFGVGGVLLGPQFEPLHEAINHVVEDGQTIDPTGHVERQLIDWYFAAARNGASLPPPYLCTIVSSLDPCMQCTGAILATGFRCLAIAEDSMAGVHYAGWGLAKSLPPELRAEAVCLLGCFAIAGERAYSGPDDPLLAASQIERGLLTRAKDAFLRTLGDVQQTIAAGSADRLSHPTLPPPALRENFTIERLRDLAPDAVYRRLRDLAPAEGGRRHGAACFVDAHNGIGAFARCRSAASPIATAIMELVRGYTRLRWDAARRRLGAPAHPKNCTLYTLEGPARTALGVMAVGAVGSTLEGPVMQPLDYWRFFHETQRPAELDAMLDAFPPLYRDVIGLRPTRVTGIG